MDLGTKIGTNTDNLKCIIFFLSSWTQISVRLVSLITISVISLLNTYTDLVHGL